MKAEITIIINEELDEFIQATGDTYVQFLNKAIGLYRLSIEARQNGKRIGIADKLETEFVGF